MKNREFRDKKIKPLLESGNYGFDRVMSDGGDRLHNGTNQSNEIGLLKVGSYNILQKVMLTSHKYHQRRKALTEMVSAWLDEGLGGKRVVPLTYAETFESLDWRFLGIKRRFERIRWYNRFPTADEYRSWLNDGSELMTPPEIVASGGKIVWRDVEDRP